MSNESAKSGGQIISSTIPTGTDNWYGGGAVEEFEKVLYGSFHRNSEGEIVDFGTMFLAGSSGPTDDAV
tara:strand:- start:409 stop:615 length:207 start_codon:yes stop_codon:yes gene_type:complete